jgi:RNA polymerase sigma-70 factor (ECF subfamily)
MDPTRAERYEAMFRSNYPAVRGYALRRTSPEAAQDAVAETFLVAWRRFDEVPRDALPWLFGVARRVLSNQRRSSGRGSALEERLATASAASADMEESVGEAQLIRDALGLMSDRDREVLMLVAWHGLSSRRAARALGCSRTAFDVRLHRARRRLAALLEGLEPGELAGMTTLETS